MSPQAEMSFVEGDATRPLGAGLRIIAHCCNNLGGWGSGFVVALSRRWSRPESEYRNWHRQKGAEAFRDMLGHVQLVPVEEDLMVANIIGQNGLRQDPEGNPPIRYDALERGFRFIASYIQDRPELSASVHVPRIGCGLAGGSWSKVEPVLHQELTSKGIPVTVYTFPGASFNP